MAAVIPGARLEVIPDASHIFWTDQPQAAREAIESFCSTSADHGTARGSSMMVDDGPFRRVRIGLGLLALVLVSGRWATSCSASPHQRPLPDGEHGHDGRFARPTRSAPGARHSRSSDPGGRGHGALHVSAVLELLIEGHMRDLVRSDGWNATSSDARHVIVCGWAASVGGRPFPGERRARCRGHRP